MFGVPGLQQRTDKAKRISLLVCQNHRRKSLSLLQGLREGLWAKGPRAHCIIARAAFPAEKKDVNDGHEILVGPWQKGPSFHHQSA